MTRYVRLVIAAAAVVGGALVAAPGIAQAQTSDCAIVLTTDSGAVVDTFWYEHADILYTSAGPIQCNNGVWEGPTVDSPMPGGPVLA